MAKNSVALFLFAVITKGAGLIIAVLVARFLGASALGTYAAVLSLSLLLENLVPLGQQIVIIRRVARDPGNLLSLWFNSSVITFLVSLVMSSVLAIVIHAFIKDVDYSTSAYIVAIYLPVAGLFIIAMAFVQGLEQMEAMTIAALIGRIAGLLVLWFLLKSDLKTAAAFIGYGVYQLVGLIALSWIILRKSGKSILPHMPSLDLMHCWSTIRTSFPLAIQTLLRSALDQLSVLILPLLVTMELIGMFDAADRIRQTSSMIIPIITTAILPALARTILSDRIKARFLMEKALKMLQVVILPFVFFVAIAADQIIPLLYGPGYEAAIPVLRIVIWAQLFFVIDAVLNLVMLASDNETTLVRFTALSLGLNILLVLALAPRYGAAGTAAAVVITCAFDMALNAQFVSRRITPINLAKTIGRTLPCVFLSSIVALISHKLGLWISFILFGGSYVIFLWAFRVFTMNEMLLAQQLTLQLGKKSVALITQQFKNTK